MIIPAPGHSWDSGVITKEPACTVTGEKIVTCTVCGAKEVRTIPILCHAYVFTGWTWLGNETDGYKEATIHYTCSREGCNKTQFWRVDPEAKTIQPTCTEGGKTVYTAMISQLKAYDNQYRSAKKEARFTDPLGHDYKETEGSAKAATCTEAGKEADQVCSRCGDAIDGAFIPSLGHEWVDWHTWTTGDKIHEERSCSRCGITEEREYDQDHITHIPVNISERPASCTADGVKAHVQCEVCKHLFVVGEDGNLNEVQDSDLIIPAKGHMANEPVRENEVTATCTETGSYERVVYCGNCSEELRRITCTIPALGHDYQAVEGTAQAASCTEAGKEADQKCSRCGDVVNGIEISVLGHDWGDWIVTRPATSTEDGEKEHTCSRCAATETQAIPKVEPELIKIAIPTGKTLTYNGKAQTGVADGTGYSLSGTTSAANAGSYQAAATLDEGYVWSDGTTAAKIIKWKIKQAANPLNIKAKKVTVKYIKLKKKDQTLEVTRVISFKKDAKDKKTYSLISARKGKKNYKKNFKLNKNTGKVTVKKGLKKGTYKVKVKIQAAGNINYMASAVKTVTFTIKVK